jgi:hypothetical protein
MAVATISLFDTVTDSSDAAVPNALVTLTFGYNQATTSDGLLMPSVRQITTDATGKFTFSKVIPNDLISPANSVYQIDTPFRTYQVAPQSGNGASQQSTAANVIVNTPSPLAPATSNVTGPLTVQGLLTAQAGLAVTGNSSISGNLTITGTYLMGPAQGLQVSSSGTLLIGSNGNATQIVLGSGLTGTIINAQNGLSLRSQAVAYTSSQLQLDFSVGNVVTFGAMTGTMTINYPANMIVGSIFFLIFNQDGAGGHTVVWNSGFFKNMPQPRAGAFAVSCIAFVEDNNGNLVYVSGP